MDNIVAGDVPVMINTQKFNLTVQKTLLESLGDTAISNGQTSFILPSLDQMRLTFDDNGTEKYSDVEIAVR